MTANEKILESLRSATTYLENSMLALKKKNENSFIDSIWHLAAEMEYTLFLFSVTLQNERDKSEWKSNPELKKSETGPMLAAVQNLLNKAEKSVANQKLLDAHENTHIARDYILKVQKDIAKKKREALKKK